MAARIDRRRWEARARRTGRPAEELGEEEEARVRRSPFAGVTDVPLLADFWTVYERERLLGQGAFGKTIAVRRRGTRDERYALKILGWPPRLSVLRHEARALERLSTHPDCRPHVACFYGAFAIPGRRHGYRFRYATLSDLVPGSTLEQLVERRGSPGLGCDALPLLAGLLAAVQVVHDAGFVHRDIKPANAIRRQPGNDVVLIDFGLACAPRTEGGPTGEATCETGVKVGTPDYWAPEFETGGGIPATASPAAHRAADMYSVGATAYFLITGRLREPSRRVDTGLGPCIDSLVSALMSEDPADRPDVHEAGVLLARCIAAGACKPGAGRVPLLPPAPPSPPPLLFGAAEGARIPTRPPVFGKEPVLTLVPVSGGGFAFGTPGPFVVPPPPPGGGFAFGAPGPFVVPPPPGGGSAFGAPGPFVLPPPPPGGGALPGQPGPPARRRIRARPVRRV